MLRFFLAVFILGALKLDDVTADVYDNCGANNENCFGIADFESDLETCLAQRVIHLLFCLFLKKDIIEGT